MTTRGAAQRQRGRGPPGATRSTPEVDGRPCLPSLDDLPEPVDLVVLGVPDPTLLEQLHDRRPSAATAARWSSARRRGSARSSPRPRNAGGMALCGGGCMGFVNPARGIRAIGYVERDELGPGGVAIVTALRIGVLRAAAHPPALDFSLAVSAGQELVTTLSRLPATTRSTARRDARHRAVPRDAARRRRHARRRWPARVERDIPVVALTVGGSPTGRAMVAAHSGALAGDDGAWEALFDAYGVHRVTSLDELTDTLELFAIGRRVPRSAPRAAGIATVHDSGGERALVADGADAWACRSPCSPTRRATARRSCSTPASSRRTRSTSWGTGADTETLFAASMRRWPTTRRRVVALAIDLVHEYDGDESYPRAMQTVAARTDKPVVVLSNIASAVDQGQAALLRAAGIPVLEGTD